MTAPQALVFDLYGTLLDPGSVEAACAEVTGDPAALAALWRRTQLEYTWLRSLMARYEDFEALTGHALDHAAAALGVDLDPAARAHVADAWLALTPYPEVGAALERMAGLRLAVLSNGSPAMLEGALRAARLRERFSVVLSADEVRAYKPSPAVYALAERRLGLPRGAILFVSANGWDATGAAAFGLPTAWVNRAGRPPEALGAGPDLVVRDLGELADAVLGAL
jgi:2-haloacid dehalogenase